MKPVALALAAVSFATLGAPPAAAAPLLVAGEKGSLSLDVRLENTHVHVSQPAVHVLATLRAEAGRGGERRPVNLALVVDRSGSMSGQKIADARDAALQMVDLLRDGDRVAIVSYSDGVRVDLPSVEVDARSREDLRDAIRRISASGSTNLAGGLVAGHTEVRRHLDSDKVNRVVLISDGLANVGVTSVPALNRIAREASQEGIVTTTLGLGADYNEDLMTSVADHGGGNYHYVQESKQIAGVLAGELGQMMATVAKQGTLEVTLPAGVEVDEVFGYAWQAEGRTVVVRLGDVFAGQQRSILLRLRAPKREGHVELGTIALAWQDMNAGGARRSARAPMDVTVTSSRDLVAAHLDKEVAARIAEIELATSMQKAATLAQEGRFDDAKRELEQANLRARSQAKALGAQGARLEKSAGESEKLYEDLDAAPASAEEQKKAVKKMKAGSYKMQKL